MAPFLIKGKAKKFLSYLINSMITLGIVAPIIYVFFISLMTPAELFEYPPRIIPRALCFENYIKALTLAPIFQFIFNSFIVAATITLSQLITSSLAAFVFAFMKFKGKNLIFLLILSTMMIPGHAIIISNYLTISSWGILDTYLSLVLPYLTSAFGIFLLRQSFLTLPGELYEAAKLDGCGNFKFLTRIVIPLSKPAIGSLGIYQFIHAWNMYTWPLLVTNSDGKRTVQIGLSMLQNVDSQEFGPIMAGVIMILAPSILAFIIGQKQLISGLTSGSVKG